MMIFFCSGLTVCVSYSFFNFSTPRAAPRPRFLSPTRNCSATVREVSTIHKHENNFLFFSYFRCDCEYKTYTVNEKKGGGRRRRHAIDDFFSLCSEAEGGFRFKDDVWGCCE